jgi:hypothetical protein
MRQFVTLSTLVRQVHGRSILRDESRPVPAIAFSGDAWMSSRALRVAVCPRRPAPEAIP